MAAMKRGARRKETGLNLGYGWIPDLPDHRDILYGAVHRVAARLPASVDLRRGCSPVEDQGDLGSCTGNALAGAVEFLEKKDGIPLVNVSVKDLVNLADKFATALDQAAANPAGTVQALQDQLKEAFGIPKASNALTLALFTDGSQYFLRITIDLNKAFTKSLSVNMDLGGGLMLGGSAGLSASGNLDAVNKGGNAITGAYLLTQTDAGSSTMLRSESNQTALSAQTQSESSTDTKIESGDDVTGSYSLTEAGTGGSTVFETDSNQTATSTLTIRTGGADNDSGSNVTRISFHPSRISSGANRKL